MVLLGPLYLVKLSANKPLFTLPSIDTWLLTYTIYKGHWGGGGGGRIPDISVTDPMTEKQISLQKLNEMIEVKWAKTTSWGWWNEWDDTALRK